MRPKTTSLALASAGRCVDHRKAETGLARDRASLRAHDGGTPSGNGAPSNDTERRALGLVVKKSAKIPTDITKDRIRERLLKTELVDVKICAVSDIWSDLKFVVRKERR